MNNKLIAGTIVLLVVLTSIVSCTTTSVDAETSHWQYDDYKIVTDAVNVSGVLEFSTVGNVDYVHAKDVGTGHITYSDGRIEEITVERAKLDVWLMTGQSNAAYFFREDTKDETVDPSKADPVPLPGTAYYYGTDDSYDCLEKGSPTFKSMVSENGGAAIGDKAPPFAATYYEKTGHKVYWICGAVSGTYVYEFDPINKGPVWTYMERVIPHALDAVDDSKFIVVPQGYMWIQGEYNADTPVEEYKSDFIKMHHAILAGNLGIKFSHCFVSQVASGNSRIALEQISIDDPTVTISADVAKDFNWDNGLLADEAHYTQLGDNIVGVKLGESCGSWVSSQPDSGNNDSYYPVLLIVLCIIPLLALFVAFMFKYKKSDS